jgi:tetratricopeptide (TPR) repeat protein
MKCYLFAFVNFASIATLASMLIAQTGFRDELNLGVQAYKQAKYEEAIQHFQSAASLDPKNALAHLYLATSYAQQYSPGVEAPENAHWAEAAISEYEAVLRINSQSMDSLKGIAYLRLQQKKFDNAKAFFHEAIEVDAGDPENYYSVGVIDWTQAYTRRTAEYSKLKMRPDEFLINKAECWSVRIDSSGERWDREFIEGASTPARL